MLVTLSAIIMMLVLLVLGTPMVAALLAAVAVNFVLGGQWAMMVPQTMVSGVSQFTLIALPLFVPSPDGRLPDHNLPPSHPPATRTRARRRDERLEDTAFLPSLRVYRYR